MSVCWWPWSCVFAVVQRAGLVPVLCFNLMTVCSLNTLLFNGNPLLRYDGYYLLSDLLRRRTAATGRGGACAAWPAAGC